jgi:hypothetical protein
MNLERSGLPEPVVEAAVMELPLARRLEDAVAFEAANFAADDDLE